MSSFKKIFRLNQALFFANVSLLVIACGLFALFFLAKGRSDLIDARRIVLRSEEGTPMVVLQGDQESALLTLNDDQGQPRLQLQGGEFPAVMIKNGQDEVIGTFFPLREGGTAIGLGNQQGEMATFIRGGSAPGIGLYHHAHMPHLAMGISEQTPHFLLFPLKGAEGMVIDGSEATSLLFFDREGQVPVALSRYGLYQNGQEEERESRKTADSYQWRMEKGLRAALQRP